MLASASRCFRDGYDLSVRCESIFVANGVANARILIVVDEDGEGISALIIFVSADDLAVSVLFPIEQPAYVLVRVFFI